MTDADDATGSAASVPGLEAAGARIPALGFGTWELTGEVAGRMVERALEAGYRHVDTARMYGNESEVGRGLAASGVPREDVFLVTKIWPEDYRPAAFREAVEGSLRALGTGYVDLLLLHWPRFRGTTMEETLEALARAREEGRARHVGVCNFNTELLARAREDCPAPLAVNQVEYHPYLAQDAVLGAVREAGMVLTAYSPLAHGRVADDPALAEIGERHGKTAAQVALRWLLQQEGVSAIPRTSDPDHLRENLAVFDFELTGEEMERVAGLARPDGRVIDPAGLAPEWD